MADDSWSVRERAWAAVVSGGLVVAALSPLLQYRRPAPLRVGGFPLSFYPMFAVRREQRGTVSYAVGVAADGSRRNLHHSALGPGGVNQVRKQIYRAVDRGRARRHAELVANRVAGRADCADVVRVEIVRGTFDLDDCLLRRRVEGVEEVLAEAGVSRGVDETPGGSAEGGA